MVETKKRNKIKYMIHCVPIRKWYVDKYLIPSMIDEGINPDDIYVYEDYYMIGNLPTFLESLKYINDNLNDINGVWHLQDDVIISRDFKEITEEKGKDKVINGFVNENYCDITKCGLVKPKDYWYSFPCIYIPNKYIEDFLKWVDKVKYKSPYRNRYNQKRYDDWFFYKFLKEEHPEDYMYNLKPNIVDHVDYLLGFTTGKRSKKEVRASFYKDLDLVKELERKIKNEIL